MLIDFGFVFFEEIKPAVTFDVASEATAQAACTLYSHVVNVAVRQIEFTDICPYIILCPNRQWIGCNEVCFKRIAAVFEPLLQSQTALARHCADERIQTRLLLEFVKGLPFQEMAALFADVEGSVD